MNDKPYYTAEAEALGKLLEYDYTFALSVPESRDNMPKAILEHINKHSKGQPCSACKNLLYSNKPYQRRLRKRAGLHEQEPTGGEPRSEYQINAREQVWSARFENPWWSVSAGRNL